MSVEQREYQVRVHNAEDGSLWADVPELPGCFASGHTVDELLESLQEAISLYVADEPDAATISDVKHVEGLDVLQVEEMRVRVPA